MNTAKIVISWQCNLDCSYCCNKQQAIRDSFKPITLEEIKQSNYDDYEITGGEPLTNGNSLALRRVLQAIPRGKNIYLYTNGLNLNRPTACSLAYLRVTGVNVGYHQVDLDWDILRVIDETILPIRLWVKKGEVMDRMKGFDIHEWKLGDCDAVTTDRFVLEL